MYQVQKKNYRCFRLEKPELLQLVSELLVWILRIIDNCVVVINFRTVHTRQRTRTEPPSLERRGRNQGAQGWQDKDPLDDTTSHALVIPTETLQGGAVVVGEGQRPNQTEEVPLVAAREIRCTTIDYSNWCAPAVCKCGTPCTNSKGSDERHSWLDDTNNSRHADSTDSPCEWRDHGQHGATGETSEEYEGNGLRTVYGGTRCRNSREMDQEGREDYDPDKHTRGFEGELCNPAIV